MEMTIKQVQNLSSNELLESLFPIIDNLYSAFERLSISKQEYWNIILQEIENSKQTYKGDEPYSQFMKKQFYFLLIKRIKSLDYDLEMIYFIINDYIDHSIKNPFNVLQAIQCIKELGYFLSCCDVVFSQDQLIELIEQNVLLHDVLKWILESFDKQNQGQDPSIILDNTLLMSLLDAYNVLEYKKSNDFNDDFEKDSTQAYLMVAGKRPLLSAQQEKELFYRIEQGDMEAKTILIESNLRIVISIAREYQTFKLTLLDLIQEGNLGLMKAIERFDIRKGFRFTTYAEPWIRSFIRRAIANNERTIRIPVHLYNDLSKFRKEVQNLSLQLNREPMVEEIMEKTGLSIHKIMEYQTLLSQIISLNEKIGNEQDTELGELIASSDEALEDIAIQKSLPKIEIMQLLESCALTQNEILVLLLRNGFFEGRIFTFLEIGNRLGLSKERIRQIEANALKKIRKSEKIKDFAVYMENPDQALENIEAYRVNYQEKLNPHTYFLK